ncbi:MAG: sulfatase-like hydrolase/transferase, partial [Vicingaceae bacterium]
LTGFPAFFGVDGNSIFQSTYYSKISSISHTLKKANYDLTYMVGDARHSGLKDMLYSLKINNIIDQQNLGKNIKTEDDYGARDKDLFDRAKKEIEEKVSKNKPFALFLSTTDTHFPDGIYDERMEAYIPPQRSNLEFMVSAVDYMIGDLIEFLKKENALSNTSIYIYPDHLKMGDPTIFNESGDRALYLLTNASQDHIGVDTNELLFQLDLPKIILNGSNVKHNQKFLTDYIPNDTDKNEYVKNNILEIIALNTSGLLRINNNSQVNLKTELSKHYQEYKEDKSRFIAHAGGKIDGRTYTNSLEALNESYKKGFKLFELDIIKTKEGEYVAAHDWQQWADITNYKSDVPVSKEEFLNHKIFERYTPMSMDEINDWFKNHPDAILVTDKVNEPKLFSEQFIDKDRLMMELFTLEAVKEGLASNIKSAMPSQQIIESFGKNKLNQLKELGVTDVAFSRRYIVDNVDFLKQLKAEGIRSYVFHINFDPGIDEDYVVKYEMDYIYGIYADKWSFPAEDSVVNRAKKPISSK